MHNINSVLYYAAHNTESHRYMGTMSMFDVSRGNLLLKNNLQNNTYNWYNDKLICNI